MYQMCHDCEHGKHTDDVKRLSEKDAYNDSSFQESFGDSRDKQKEAHGVQS
jgi:hypothetical protein